MSQSKSAGLQKSDLAMGLHFYRTKTTEVQLQQSSFPQGFRNHYPTEQKERARMPAVHLRVRVRDFFPGIEAGTRNADRARIVRLKSERAA